MNQEDWDQLKEEIHARSLITQNGGEGVTRTDVISFHFAEILKALGYDLSDENLIDTPRRVARYLQEFLVDYQSGNMETHFDSVIVDQMVMVKEIPFWSLCQHHVLPFRGTCSIAYMTGSKVLGLSKIPRVVQKHAHKLQLQEKLAHDIADDLEKLLIDSAGVAVIIEAEHSCMQLRGIRSEGGMTTSVLRGDFREDQSVRYEFFNLLNR